MNRSRYFGEGVLVMILMILILLLMIKESATAQTTDPLTETNYQFMLPLTSEVPSSYFKEQNNQANTDYEDKLKVFVLDESMMVELMKQDEKIAKMMIAAVVRAIGNDVKICEMIKWDLLEANEVTPTVEVGHQANCKMNEAGKTCNCHCKCCKNPKS